jgi:NAD+ kinase
MARFTLPAALSAMTEAAAWLEARQCTPIVEAEAATAAGVERRWATASRETLAGKVDAILAFGGDGTLLDAASVVAHSSADVPLLGVNLGRLGFLTEVARADMLEALESTVAGHTRTETRLLLAGHVLRSGQRAVDRLALNDIVVTRGALSRMIELDVAVDDQFVCHVKADGLIVASATGSTAYNLSAGGPIVHPVVDALVLTPIAPHTLTNRPLVLPATARISLQPDVDTGSDLVVTFDGQFGVPLESHDVVTIARAPRVLRLLRLTSRTHFDMLREKLQWGR